MGLFGGGNSNTTTTVFTTTNTGENTASSSLSGIGGTSLVISPQVQGQTADVGGIYGEANDYYAPLDINASQNYGDSAVQAAQAEQQQQVATQGGAGQDSLSAAITSLFNSTSFVYVLAAIAILFFGRQLKGLL
jgi:hypothetical protein